jgi:chemotaxis protein CheX
MKRRNEKVNVKYINPFIAGSQKVLQELVGFEPKVEQPKLLDNTVPGSDLVVIIGLIGEIKGQVMFVLDSNTSINIAKKMTFDESLNELNELAESAMSEMANMISGSTSMFMYADKIVIDITPPSLCRGEGMKISSKNKFVSIPLGLGDLGKIYINISFEETKKEG